MTDELAKIEVLLEGKIAEGDDEMRNEISVALNDQHRTNKQTCIAKTKSFQTKTT